MGNPISSRLIAFQEMLSALPGLTQHLLEMTTVLQDWAQCLIELLQEAVTGCVGEDKMGTGGHYSRRESSDRASRCFLLLTKTAVCLLHPIQKEQDGFYYKGKLQRITPNKQGSQAGRGEIWRRWMISGVNISTWEQPQKEACRATEGAIVLIMQAPVRVIFLCRLWDLVDKTVRYIYL